MGFLLGLIWTRLLGRLPGPSLDGRVAAGESRAACKKAARAAAPERRSSWGGRALHELDSGRTSTGLGPPEPARASVHFYSSRQALALVGEAGWRPPPPPDEPLPETAGADPADPFHDGAGRVRRERRTDSRT